jgi:hypothetical protein
MSPPSSQTCWFSESRQVSVLWIVILTLNAVFLVFSIV